MIAEALSGVLALALAGSARYGWKMRVERDQLLRERVTLLSGRLLVAAKTLPGIMPKPALTGDARRMFDIDYGKGYV